MNILIFGAGSVGAHHAYAASFLKANVTITDINKNQLLYLKKKLYPSRYGKWNKKINIISYSDVFNIKDKIDLIVLGISPLNHMQVLKDCLKKLKFNKILVEKPLFVFNQKINLKTFKKFENKIYCGFNHEISESILFIKKYIKSKKDLQKIKIKWAESFNYLLNAHPWIKGIDDTYLSNIYKGGGVLHEFSHAVHLTNSLKNLISRGKNLKLNSKIIYKKSKDKKKYDILSKILLKNNNFEIETYIDGISTPPEKKILVYSKDEKLIWERLADKNIEKVLIFRNGKKKFNKTFKISRPQDFIAQTKVLISNQKKNINNLKCNNFKNSMATMLLIKKCIKNF